VKRLTTFISAAILSTALMWTGNACADKASAAAKKGIDAYNEKNYEDSSMYFSEALVERPDSPEIKFNLGTALSEQKLAEDAVRTLESAASEFSDPAMKAEAHYNAGNTLFLTGDLKQAIDHFKQAVKLDQNDSDYRHNLELAVRKYQQQQKQQQQRPEQKKKDDKQNKQDMKDEDTTEDENSQQNKDSEQEQKEERSKTQNSEQDQRQDSEQQQSNQQMNQDSPMTLDEARRILDALSDEEKRALSLRKQEMKQEMRQGDDW